MKGKILREGEPWIDIKDSIEKLPDPFKTNYNDGKDFLYLLDMSDMDRQEKFNELVLGVYNDHLYVLERVDDKIKTFKISYLDVEFIEKSEILLRGKLDIISGDVQLTINYNTVSSDTIDELIKKIREGYASTVNPIAAIELKTVDKNDFEFIFQSLLNEFELKKENLFYLAFQSELGIYEKKEEECDIYEPHLGGGIYTSNGNELLILEKGEKFVEDEKIYHGFHISYIPFNKITSAELTPHKHFPEVSQLMLNFSKKSVGYLFNKDNNETNKLLDYLQNTIK